MRQDFLTIPAAPNYEINSNFVCRNKKTGYVLKLYKEKNGSEYYSMMTPAGKKYHRGPKFLRRVALAAANEDSFEPIPSLDYRYEINRAGTVRNAKTKRIVKPIAKNRKSISFRYSGRNFICRNIGELLWEVHGQTFKPTKQPCPCSIQRG